MLPGAFEPEPLAGAVAGAGVERARRPRLLADQHVDIAGAVLGRLLGQHRLGRDGAEQAGRDHRLAQIVDLAAVVEIAALEAGQDIDMAGVEDGIALGW